ncbi:MAG: transcription termination/antitermination protein NusG [Oscillospiraceae bacterium]|nr:transcription termination/antitermination protein NusG [Oscillospiraceae bacterium]
MAEEAKWYVVHTYSGYENTVKVTIEKSVENRRLQDLIHEVLIPMETVTEVTDSGTKTVERKVYPGYVLVKMIMTDEAWYVINSVRGVTGFVGADADAKPMIRAIPLTEEEVYALGIEKHQIEVPYTVGDSVRIMDGPLTTFVGHVDALDVDNNSVRVVVSMFGRETPVELELDQVELVQD